MSSDNMIPVGPVLTEDLVERLVAGTEYHLYQGTTLMSCTLKLCNGFAVVGTSSSLPTTRFNPQLGMKYSREDAMNKLQEHLAVMVYDATAPDNRRVSAVIQNAINALKEGKQHG